MAWNPDEGEAVQPAPRSAAEGMTLDQIRALEGQGMDPRQVPYEKTFAPIDVGEISPILGGTGGSEGMQLLPADMTNASELASFAASVPRRITGAAAATIPAVGGMAAGGVGALWNEGMNASGMGDDVPWYDRVFKGGADAWKRAYQGREEGVMGAITDPVNIVSMLAPPLAETRIVGQLGKAAANALRTDKAQAGVRTLARGLEGAAYGDANSAQDAAIGAGMGVVIPPLATKAALSRFPGIERMQDFSEGFAGRQKTSMTNIKADEADLLRLIDQTTAPTRAGLFKADRKNLDRAGEKFEAAFESVPPEHRAISVEQLRGLPGVIRQDLEEKAALGMIPGDPITMQSTMNHKADAFNLALDQALAVRARQMGDVLPDNAGLIGKQRAYTAETDAMLGDLADPYLSLRDVQALRKRFQSHYGPGSTEAAGKQMDELINSHLNERLLAAPGYKGTLGDAANEYRTALQLGRLLNYNKLGKENSYVLPIMLRKLGTPGGLSGLPFAATRSALTGGMEGGAE